MMKPSPVVKPKYLFLSLSLAVLLLFSGCQSEATTPPPPTQTTAPPTEIIEETPIDITPDEVERTPSETDATLAIVPITQNVKVGETTEFAVKVESIEDLYGIELEISFDPEVFEPIDVDQEEKGIQSRTGEFLWPDFVYMNDYYPEEGNMVYIATQIAPREPAEGDGTIISLSLKAKSAGQAELAIAQAFLSTPNGDFIPVEIQPATAVIVSQ